MTRRKKPANSYPVLIPDEELRGAEALGLSDSERRREVVATLIDLACGAPNITGSRRKEMWANGVLNRIYLQAKRYKHRRDGVKFPVEMTRSRAKKIERAAIKLHELLVETRLGNYDTLNCVIAIASNARAMLAGRAVPGRRANEDDAIFFVELLGYWQVASGARPSRQPGSRTVSFLTACARLRNKVSGDQRVGSANAMAMRVKRYLEENRPGITFHPVFDVQEWGRELKEKFHHSTK